MSPLCFHDHLGPTLGEFFIPNELTKSHFLARYLDVPGSGWINGDRINGSFHLLINGIYILGFISHLIRSPLIPALPETRDIQVPSWQIRSFSRQTQEEIVARMLLPRKFLSQLIITLPTTRPAEDPQNTSVRPAAQKYSMASPSALPKCSTNGWWLVEFQPVWKICGSQNGNHETPNIPVENMKHIWKHHLEKWCFILWNSRRSWKFESSDGPLICR